MKSNDGTLSVFDKSDLSAVWITEQYHQQKRFDSNLETRIDVSSAVLCLGDKKETVAEAPVEIHSRVVSALRPLSNWQSNRKTILDRLGVATSRGDPATKYNWTLGVPVRHSATRHQRCRRQSLVAGRMSEMSCLTASTKSSGATSWRTSFGGKMEIGIGTRLMGPRRKLSTSNTPTFTNQVPISIPFESYIYLLLARQ